MIGFNNSSYDSKMVNAFLSKEVAKMNKQQRIEYLRTISDNAIDKNDDEGHADRQRNNHYDTRIGSLKKNRRPKEWQLLMGMSVQESPVNFDEDLTDDNSEMAIEYCMHDVDATEMLFNTKCLDNFNYGKTASLQICILRGSAISAKHSAKLQFFVKCNFAMRRRNRIKELFPNQLLGLHGSCNICPYIWLGPIEL